MLYACVGAQIGPAGVQRGPEATASSHNHRPYRIKPTPTEPPRQGATSISNGIPSGRMLIFVSRGAISESGPNFAPVWTRQVRIPGPDSSKHAGEIRAVRMMRDVERHKSVAFLAQNL